MARATTCILQGQEIGVDEALLIREEAKQNSNSKPDFRCGMCDKKVILHKGSPYGQAHIEHEERNADCPRSDASG